MIQDFELFLHNISAGESMMFAQTYKEYKKEVAFLLAAAGKYYTEKQIRSRYHEPDKISMEKILKDQAAQFEKYMLVDDEKGNRVMAWFDIWDNYVITKKDKLHDLFFTYKLRQTDLLNLDDFLDYQLANHFNNDFEEFERFLHIVLRKYKKKLLVAEHIKTIKEWIELRKKTSLSKEKLQAIVKWTGTKSDNKNEFVQLIYALHKAGFINNGKGEITKIVESLSEVFGIELGKNWQSNHSASIHKAKHNYEPPVFKKIKEAYKEYTSDLVREKFKN